MKEEPDRNCITLPNGDCISEDTCMHTPKEVERLKAMSKMIDEVIARAPLETDHGHHREAGWLKGRLRES